MNIRPLHNKVLIERVENNMTTSTGIILQRSEEPDKAKVIAVGPDVETVEVDNIVLCDWSKATKVKDQYIITESNIVFIYGD